MRTVSAPSPHYRPKPLDQEQVGLRGHLLRALRRSGPGATTHSAKQAFVAHPEPTDPSLPRGHVIVTLGVPVDHDGRIGPALRSRIQRTLEVGLADPHALIIVSGDGVQNRFGEAATMARELIGQGIAPSRIRIEGRAQTTVDNAAFVWPMLSAHLGLMDRLTVVAEPYHAMRGLRMFTLLNATDPKFIDIRLAASDRIPPNPQQFQSELARVIEEKRRVALGW